MDCIQIVQGSSIVRPTKLLCVDMFFTSQTCMKTTWGYNSPHEWCTIQAILHGEYTLHRLAWKSKTSLANTSRVMEPYIVLSKEIDDHIRKR